MSALFGTTVSARLFQHGCLTTVAAMPLSSLAVVKFKKASNEEPAQAKQLDPGGNLRHFANLNARFKHNQLIVRVPESDADNHDESECGVHM